MIFFKFEKSPKEDLNESIKSFDTQEFEELEKELADETLAEYKNDTKDNDIKLHEVEDSNDQNQKASNINVLSEAQTIKIEVFFIELLVIGSIIDYFKTKFQKI